MPFIDGELWQGGLGFWSDDISLASQWGEAMSRLVIAETNSSKAVDEIIIPGLKRALDERIPVSRIALRHSIQDLITIAPSLKSLPLVLAHLDLNPSNVRH